MTIREARFSDAPSLAVLSGQLGYPMQTEETEERLRVLQTSDTDAILVAESDEGDVVGWIHLSGALRLETGRYAEIAGLVVDEAWRSRGVGAALVEAGAEWAAGRGYQTFKVRSNIIRERAHAFYERLGFAHSKTQVVLVRRLDQ